MSITLFQSSLAGMINNFQRNAGSEDDRDSASMSLIVNMEVGDEVLV